MQISMNTNLNMNLEKKVVVSNSTLPEVTSQQQSKEDSQNNIAVHMTLSKEGKLLSESMKEAEKKTDSSTIEEEQLIQSRPEVLEQDQMTKEQIEELNQKFKANINAMEDQMTKKDHGTEVEQEQALKDVQEQKERDYSKYIVESDIIAEMNQKNADFAKIQKEKQQDLNIIIESLGDGERKQAKNTEQTKDKTILGGSEEEGDQLLQDGSIMPEDRIESLKTLANKQATHVVGEAFDKEQKYNEFIDKREDKIDQYQDEILDAQKEVNRIKDSIDEQKNNFSEEDFASYKDIREGEMGAFTDIIKENKKYIKGEIHAMRMVKQAHLGSQNMSNANNQAEEIQKSASAAIKQEMMQGAMENIDKNVSKVEISQDVDKKLQENEDEKAKEKDKQEKDFTK